MTETQEADATEERTRQLLATMRTSDSVELKLTVPAAEHRSTIAALNIDPIGAQIREVDFLDTPDLQLNTAGLVVRTRRIQGKCADSVVELRPVVPEELSRKLRQTTGFGVEVNAMPGSWVCSASLKGRSENLAVMDAVTGRNPPRRLFSKEQRNFYKDHAPAAINLDDLTFLEPFFVIKSKWTPPEQVRPLVAEMWFYPYGSRILELSTKCRPDEGFQVAVEARAYLMEKGVSLTGEQETKTKRALEYFVHENEPQAESVT